SCSRIDQGVGRLIEILKAGGHWEDTLFLYCSDHGIAMPGAKTTVYEGGMRAPLLVRNPYSGKRGTATSAMVSWVDLTPTILDFAGALNDAGQVKPPIVAKIPSPDADSQTTRNTKRGDFHGRSFLPILETADPKDWDTVYASHTFHEIQMYYPMRVVRGRRY